MRGMRFGIRDILWLTLVIALILGWSLWWLSLPAAEATANGEITVGGAPLADGRICLCSESGQIIGSTVARGKFSIPQIPAGKYAVTIDGAAVPAKYGNKSSGLTVAVRQGRNQFNFELRS